MSPATHWARAHAAWALGVTAAVVVAAALLPPPPPGLRLAILAGLVAILGLPHGAVDHWQGSALLRPRLGRAWLAVFGAGYGAAAVAVVAAWAAWPPLLLVGFLLLAAAHFGSEDANALPLFAGGAGRTAEVVLRGGMPVVLPPLLHPQITASLFAALLPGTASDTVAGLLEAARGLLPPYLAALALLMLRAYRSGPRMVGHEVLALVLLFATLPPLLSFTLYFCGWHAPRHTLTVLAETGHRNLGRGIAHFARGATPLTVLTIAAGAVAWWLLHEGAGGRAAVLQVVFIGLAALTVPHVLLPMLARALAARIPRRRPG
jgi:Brp/Blh family beta-carotene 15,15'-monooxygenase